MGFQTKQASVRNVCIAGLLFDYEIFVRLCGLCEWRQQKCGVFCGVSLRERAADSALHASCTFQMLLYRVVHL